MFVGRVSHSASALRRPVVFSRGAIFGGFGSSIVKKPGGMSSLSVLRALIVFFGPLFVASVAMKASSSGLGFK